MKPELESLIKQFRAAQDVGVATIRDTLSLPLPKSGPDWVHYCCANGIQKINELNGIPIYAHGYGIELKIDELTIDFDWGPNGEPDGFDAWRLYNFTLDNATARSKMSFDGSKPRSKMVSLNGSITRTSTRNEELHESKSTNKAMHVRTGNDLLTSGCDPRLSNS
jgi:hypothetical protein